MSKTLFRNFGEFWHYTKSLSSRQIDVIFSCLPDNEQQGLRSSYKDEGWDDLFKRNQIGRILDDFKKDTNIDMVFVRFQVLSGKSYYMEIKNWEYIVSLLSPFPDENTHFAIGGLETEKAGSKAVLLVPSDREANSE